MTSSSHRLAAVVLCATAALASTLVAGSAAAAEPTVGLGAAGAYAVLGGTTVTNTGPSTVAGNIGVSPGTAVPGFPPGLVTAGSIHAADAEALAAQSALTTAYNDAAARPSTAAITGSLGAGQTLIGGVYTGGAIQLDGSLTLDGEGDPNAVFIFQAASTLITASSSSVNLINGASICNVFWQVGSSATLGTGSSMVGTVMALTSITAGTNATVQGRLLARNGAVTLDSNTFTLAGCGTGDTTGGTTSPTTGGTGGTDGTGGTETGGTGTGGTGTTGTGGSTTGTGGSTTSTGGRLPSTGADNSLVIYALGITLVGAALALSTRRRVTADVRSR